jgi:ribulose bisphosphate carboxylase small subunit
MDGSNLICENCKCIHDGTYGSGRFCSQKCAKTFSTRKSINQLKEVQCIQCGTLILVGKRSDPLKCRCNDCKKPKCKWCGDVKCKRPDICKRYRVVNTMISKFGFDESKIGTIQFCEEFERIRELIIEDYYEHDLSTNYLTTIYGFNQPEYVVKFLKSIGIKLRNHSDVGLLSYKHGRHLISVNLRFKTGWHTTWNNKKVFYRSSYELEYAQELDDRMVDYEMESIRIQYWDSIDKRIRTAIPDFFIHEENYVVERRDNTHQFFINNGNFRRHLDIIDDALIAVKPSKFPNNDFTFLEKPEFESKLYLFVVTSKNLNKTFYLPLKEQTKLLIKQIRQNID